MTIETIVIVGNTLVITATFLATLYRIKIERDQIKTVKRNASASEALKSLKKLVSEEKNDLICMNKKELKEFIEYLEKLDQYTNP